MPAWNCGVCCPRLPRRFPPECGTSNTSSSTAQRYSRVSAKWTWRNCGEAQVWELRHGARAPFGTKARVASTCIISELCSRLSQGKNYFRAKRKAGSSPPTAPTRLSAMPNARTCTVAAHKIKGVRLPFLGFEEILPSDLRVSGGVSSSCRARFSRVPACRLRWFQGRPGYRRTALHGGRR
jgi:hypothetical protein